MAWTAKIAEKKLTDRGLLEVSVDYTNGTLVIRKDIQVSNAQDQKWLKGQIKAQVKILEALTAYEQEVTVGDVDLTPDPIIPPPTPTQAELNRAKWAEDYNKLQKLETLLTKKLIKSNDAELLALRTSVEADFKPEYADIVS